MRRIRKATLVLMIALAVECLPATSVAQSRAAERSGQLLFEQAMSLYNRGNPTDRQASLAVFLRAAEDFKAAGAHGKYAMALLGAGFASSSIGEDYDALGYFTGALASFRKARHRPGEVDALINIGAAHYRLNELDTSLDHFNQALALSRKLRERRGEANALTGIAQIHTARNELQKAIDAYNQALPLLRAVADREGEARAQHNLEVVSQRLREQQDNR
jgi:tetratricopeptide (TPR) repeat protein